MKAIQRFFLLCLSVLCLAVSCSLFRGPIPMAHAYPIWEPGAGVKQSAGYPGWGADVAVTVTGTSTTSGTAVLSPGLYIVVCTQATHVDQGTTGVAATTSERLIPAFSPYPLKVEGGGSNDDYVAWIRDTTSGTCILSKEVFL